MSDKPHYQALEDANQIASRIVQSAVDAVKSSRNRCSNCRHIGHYITSCPHKPKTDDDITTARIAVMREQCDALAVEITQYEEVRATLDRRIGEDQRKIIELQKAIAILRSRL